MIFLSDRNKQPHKDFLFYAIPKYIFEYGKCGIDNTIESFFLLFNLTRFFNTIASVLYTQAQDNEEDTQLYTHIVYNRLHETTETSDTELIRIHLFFQ